ncbi:bifunctional (p)ppGpp synthetase/guanosine-3',5'-bis(diphosphate) 3'-pyrophosphohydrolase [Massilia sp. Dwa41.01b]|uniref:RelA/SpoT family protein n=1 Tax=unclassified Massilia TaxID=2609279 RepID=UPI0016031E0B|nr:MULTISPECIES: bifunctional (p)ppGpp synthetase/guanosine-3',5'-bis(diphosphate) 3'-pyrophosphohydrolase [unclassified Massilia]QNA89401.1 bifunctional (p)ppGpp synthetase/guanosine-3',5'-bis(diphosphate) 3'-pyrophosphohydrolase [Massilia sp. Dwa41.01b]QNB00300.1 bifunctional (p)ppGpp synthetase/guanosine-3',5'-bis(diphosphate) 3'-pyrophosphohydrolase [Massilia sp. Se16.2.3]
MVSTAALGDATTQLLQGLAPDECVRVQEALDYAAVAYGERTCASGQNAFEFSLGVAGTLAYLRSDCETRIAGLLFELVLVEPPLVETIERLFGAEVASLVRGVQQLVKLRDLTVGQPVVGRGKNAASQAAAHVETLRKMLLAMASDMRVVLMRLASCLTTLRYFAESKRFDEVTHDYGREVMDLYAPLANRLGIWQLKWELEDLAFRFMQPDTYKRIAKMLEEKRMAREGFVASSIARLQDELRAAGIRAEVSGRPKHIFSIWNKMRGKDLDFSSLYDVRAFRVIVADEKTCYTVLGLVHNIWTPIPAEFDDYIARPKPNGYRSLHTVVTAEDGRPLEVQIRTQEMHSFAEYGVAAHWRYKEEGGSNFKSQKYDEKIAWLRQLLAWKSDVTDVVAGEEDQKEWVEKLKAATLDDRIFVLTPQARVLELPVGATPIDFAYHLHSEVGHRCRGAKIDGVMVPLNTPLRNGQTCEIITAKGPAGSAGPSRDWLSPGYTVSSRTRSKIRAWFHAMELAETLAQGRLLVEKSLQREGKTAVNLEALAHKLGFAKVDDLFVAVGKEKFSLRHVEAALHETTEAPPPDDTAVVNKSRASSVEQGAKSGVLVVGTEGLMTMLARCCKPAPPDPIVGFVTRGKGVSIHRLSCKNFAEMRAKAPERVIQTEWGRAGSETVYPVDIFILAGDRQGLLRDISDAFLREKINVTGVNTQTTKGQARMVFTAEIGSTGQLQRALLAIGDVAGVQEARRA